MRNIHCPLKTCHSTRSQGQIIFKGWFYRSSDQRYVHKYRCKSCGRYFSAATNRPEFGLKVRHLNFQVAKLYCSTVSQRRIAKLLQIDPKTVVRTINFMSNQALVSNRNHLKSIPEKSLDHVEFDELESAEHTKCKPLSIAIAVHSETRAILSFSVKSMPAKGKLAKIARKKYGYRKDDRNMGIVHVLKKIKPYLKDGGIILSDSNPLYPKHTRRILPKSTHKTVIGGRGSIGGQGELKKLIFDPLFSLNHCAAMIRANVNRMLRRTWCISKTMIGLKRHLTLFQWFYNRYLITGSEFVPYPTKT